MPELIPATNNCVDIIQPFVERLTGRASDAPDVQIMGGVGMAAFLHDRVEINIHQKEVRVPADFSVDAFRDDGTKRDIDVLVVSSHSEDVADTEALLTESVGDRLERSVFGIRPRISLDAQIAQPMGMRAFRTFLADRYAMSYDEQLAQGHVQTHVKSLFPFAVPLDPQLLETWSLIVGNKPERIPIPHPGTVLANYFTRSISGIRPRDYEKLTLTANHVFQRAPGIKDWLIEGPGVAQVELGRIIASIRTPEVSSYPLLEDVHVDTYSHSDLAEHEAFMVPELSPAEKRIVMAITAFKAGALYKFEKNPMIVKLWRMHAERRVDAVVKNR